MDRAAMRKGSSARRDGRPGDGRIEHTQQCEVIKTAEWVLDLGPEGAQRGVKWSPKETPEQVAKAPRSYTGGYLKVPLAKSVRPEVKSPIRRKKVRLIRLDARARGGRIGLPLELRWEFCPWFTNN